MLRKLSLPLLLALALVGLSPAARADFYRIRSNVLTPVLVTQSEDVAVTIQLRDSTVSLVSFEPSTGKRLGRQTLPGSPTDLQMVALGDTTRIVVLLSPGSGSLDAMIFDMDRSGRLRLRAEVSVLDVYYFYFEGTMRCSSNGAFYLVGRETNQEELYAFSLDNGQLLGRSPLPSYSAFVGLVDAPRPTVYFGAYRDGTGRVTGVDVTDPRAPRDLGSAFFPSGEFAGVGIGEAVVSGDGRYMFLADRYSGLWSIDLQSLSVVGHLGAPTSFAQIAMREGPAGDGPPGRSLALSTWENVGYTQQTLVLVDATDPRNLAVVASRPTPDTYLLFEFADDGTQLLLSVSDVLYGLDAGTLDTLWSVPVEGTDGSNPERLLMPYGSAGKILAGWTATETSFVVGLVDVPSIAGVRFVKKDLVVSGVGFDDKAVVLVDGAAQRTVPGQRELRAKKALARLAPGQTISVQVRNEVGTTSTVVDVVVPSGATE